MVSIGLHFTTIAMTKSIVVDHGGRGGGVDVVRSWVISPQDPCQNVKQTDNKDGVQYRARKHFNRSICLRLEKYINNESDIQGIELHLSG